MLSIAVLCGRCCEPLAQLARATEQHSSAGEAVLDAASSACIAPTADAAVALQATTSTIAEPPESAAERLVPVAVATSSVSIAPSAPATAAPPATKTIKAELAPATEHRSSAAEPVSLSFSSASIASTADAVVAPQVTTSTIAERPESDAEQVIPILETPQQELAYLIVNAFTHEVALDDPRAETNH